LQSQGAKYGVETEFDEAERQLANGRKREIKAVSGMFYKDFAKALEMVAPGISVSNWGWTQNYDSDKLDTFDLHSRR
jgi:hypothetical protein